MNIFFKNLELKELAAKHPDQIIILDMICFEHIILSFSKLIEWTGSGKADKIAMREVILSAVKEHKIDIDSITDRKTLEYLMGFKRYSTERVIKAVTYELTENDEWSVKGNCWGSAGIGIAACWRVQIKRGAISVGACLERQKLQSCLGIGKRRGLYWMGIL